MFARSMVDTSNETFGPLTKAKIILLPSVTMSTSRMKLVLDKKQEAEWSMRTIEPNDSKRSLMISIYFEKR